MIYNFDFRNREELIRLLDRTSSLEEKCELNNWLATQAMGWELKESDKFNLWHDNKGNPISITISGKKYYLCLHPWVDGINTENQLSFNPAFNQSVNFFDFREYLLNSIKL